MIWNFLGTNKKDYNHERETYFIQWTDGAGSA